MNAQSPAGSSSRGQTAEPTAPAPGPAPAAPVASERRMRLMDGRPEAPFVFFVKTRNMAFNGGPEHEMLIRIATAMKLETKQFCIVSAVDGDDAFDFVSEHRNRVGVFFAGTDAGSIKKHDGCVVLYTYTLQQLLEDASLKKSTWAGLQEIMKAAQ
ncbi:MAG TPA: hypothetical protein VFV50_02305 [Bdellovibrionales bacterium]|nr:hypothetical protein [Bdellovibrionales bacterium]